MKKYIAVALVIGLLCMGGPVALMIVAAAVSGSSSNQPEYECETQAQGADVEEASAGGGDGAVRLPFKGKFEYTSEHGMRDHPGGGYRMHAGIDLALIPTGGEIVAPKDGKVVEANANDPAAGNNVKIDHGGGLETRYLHLSSLDVKKGQAVKLGDPLGKEGNTGASFGAHLHFEVHENGSAIDPIPWLKKQGIKMPQKNGTATAPSSPSTGSSGGGETNTPGHAGPGASVAEAASSGEADSGSSGSFSLPKPNGPGKHTPGTKPLPIPKGHMKAFKSAEKKYGIPWQWLAGHSMEETHHWRIQEVSSAGAMGPMQFTPATWQDFGVSADGEGKADIMDVDDSVHSAANMLKKTGGTSSAESVRKAIKRYNNADWYVNDVLWISHQYANGNVSISADPAVAQTGDEDCASGGGQQQPLDAKQCVTRTLKEMDSTARAGQLVMAAMQPGQTSSLDSHISEHGLGNVLYLGEWSSGKASVKKASDHLQSKAPTPGEDKVGMMVAADQEGGEVQIMTGSGFSQIPSGVDQARMSNLKGSAKKWGAEMKEAGVNVNLAPVADTVPSSKGKANAPIGKHDRQYGSTPAAASKGASAYAKGMQEAGVEPTVKHFPGLGRITGNTDLTAEGISDTTATTSDPYLAPFADSIDAGANIVMVGSAKYPKIDRANPAMFSEKVVDGMLRDDLGFKGVAVTDDVGVAKSVADVPVGERATKFVDAGGDIVLTAQPSQVPTMVGAMKTKAGSDKAFKKKLDASVKRVLTVKHDMGLLKCAAPSSDTANAGTAPAVATGDTKKALDYAASQEGKPYILGANGPSAWDCSSLMLSAWGKAGVKMPRSARDQREWMANGAGTRIKPGEEKPGDLIFWDSYLGPNQIGHVVMVWDPKSKKTIDARGSKNGVGHFSYADEQKSKNRFEIWRLKESTQT